MHIHISPRGLPLSPAMSQKVAAKIGSLNRLGAQIIEAQVVLEQHAAVAPERRFRVRAQLVVAGPDLHGEETHGDLYSAVDLLTRKLARQLRKRKTQRLDRPRRDAQRSAEREHAGA